MLEDLGVGLDRTRGRGVLEDWESWHGQDPEIKETGSVFRREEQLHRFMDPMLGFL